MRRPFTMARQLWVLFKRAGWAPFAVLMFHQLVGRMGWRDGTDWLLHFLGGLKGYRLKTRRHAVEVAHLESWLGKCTDMAGKDYALAVELLRNRRLIKGYSDTHARGLSKFEKAMGATDLLMGREDAAEWMARVREAALQDPEGTALDGALKTVKSFV